MIGHVANELRHHKFRADRTVKLSFKGYLWQYEHGDDRAAGVGALVLVHHHRDQPIMQVGLNSCHILG